MPTRLLLLALALSCSIWASEGKGIGVESRGITISFMPWKTMTSHALSADDLRARPNFRLSVLMGWDTQKILERLPREKMEPTTEVASDIRLVIDIHLGKGKREAYIANRFYLYSEDSKRRWKMTPEFKRLFDFQDLELLK